jgi:acetolactate synthase small subunit
MLHTFIALVQDKPGTLPRVPSLFRGLISDIVSYVRPVATRSPRSQPAKGSR